MGHGASEMSDTWDENIDLTDRKNALREQLADVPIGAFPCGEVEPLMKVLGLYRSIVGGNPSHGEMDIIEARLKIIHDKTP